MSDDPHPLNDELPVRIRAIVRNMLQRITDLAKHESKAVPSATCFYPITLLAEAKGNVLCDEAGVPVIVRAPVDVPGIAQDAIGDGDDPRVVFAQPNQQVKRVEAARIAATSVSALRRKAS